ncbi:MAG: ABC transporter ATP-binding protein, partial [Smithella sp.]|nr:ABC transporter ATP-binding protein [Smithella sp.]
MADLPLSHPPVLDVRNLSLDFRQVRAVRNVSFRAPRQSIFGLVGSDGAGKSSV